MNSLSTSSMDTNSSQLKSTDSSYSSPPPWDVFLNFHGKDTRHNFTAYLYTALHQSAIRTYRDDTELERGQEISSGIRKAIQGSKASVVVLSNNYARSAWCLDELVEILACNKTKGLVVRPVFYHVDICDVRYQKDSFGEALVSHRKNYSADRIEKWRAALAEISHLYGYHIAKDANVNESETSQKILKDVASVVSTKGKHLGEYLVGIDSAVEEVYEKLSMQSDDVRAIGICGMGGIGKSTIAKAFYNKYCNKFNSSCFVENVKRTLRGPDNLLSLINQLLVQLLENKDYEVDVERGIEKLKEILSSGKVLIVLDDFDESSHLESLIQSCNWSSPECTIMMTTRDTNILSRLGIDIYMVKKLGKKESLELFSYHAFKTTIPLEDFRYLSESYVKYVDGLPLALKVLGSSLLGRTESFWKDKLEKVKRIPENKILEVLRLSYDELSDRMVKDIFLDIVFFFVEEEKDDAVWTFESCVFFPESGIPVLIERCLLTVEGNVLKMHNLIQNMGWEVIHQESQEPGKRKRLLCRENAFQLLKYQEGNDKIEGLLVDLTSWTKKDLGTNIFEIMPKLRLLEITNAPPEFKVNLKDSFKELRCIRWYYCPWKNLPSSFRPQKLILLDMQFSNLKTLWKGAMPIMKLKSMNVSSSKCLKTTPDVSKGKMLEKLSLGYCGNLSKVHKSIGMLTNLVDLNLYACSNLKRLPEQLGDMKCLKILDARQTAIEQLPDSICQLKKLNVLKLNECNNLRKLPEQIGNMEGLTTFDASFSAIEQLPDSFGQLINLVELLLSVCINLGTLPDNICKLSSLQVLKLHSCSNLDRLPGQLGGMKRLKILDASRTAIEQLPDSICQLKELNVLKLNGCKNLKQLPEQIGNIEGLTKFNASSSVIGQLPDSFERLINLVELVLCFCKNLRTLPSNIWKLSSLEVLDLECCSNLDRLPEPLGMMQCLKFVDASSTAIEELPVSIWQLSMLETLLLNGCNKLGNMPTPSWNHTSLTNMKRLKDLRLSCNIRSCLPMISCLSSLNSLKLTDVGDISFSSTKQFSLSKVSNLQTLILENCTSSGSSLPELPLNLEELEVSGYVLLEKLPDLSTFIHLWTLSILRCNSLASLPQLPPHLSHLYIDDCKSLQDTTHVTTLTDLRYMEITSCDNLKFNVGESFFQGLTLSEFRAIVPMREIPDWFSSKSSECRVFCDVPHIFSANKTSGIAFCVFYKCKSHKSPLRIRAVITNETDGSKYNYHLSSNIAGTSGSVIAYGNQDLLKYSSGDRIEILFEIVMYSFGKEYRKVSNRDVKVEKCGMHLI